MASIQSGGLIKATKNLFGIIKLDKKEVSYIYFFAILGGLISLILPLGIQTIINFVQAGSISASIIVLIGIVVLAVFINGLVQVRQMQLIEKVKQKIFTRYSLEFANIIPKFDVEKMDNYHLPELVNRYFDTVSLIKGIQKNLLDIPGAIIQILFGLLLLSFYHPVFIGFGVLLLTIVMLIVRFTSHQGLATSVEASNYKYKLAAWLQEIAANIKTFKYSKNTKLHLQKTDSIATAYLKVRTNHFKILLTQYWSLISFKIVITAAMLIIGSILLVNQQINVGQFIAADIVIISIINSVEKLISSLDTVYDTLTSVEKLSKIVDAEIEKSGSLIFNPNMHGASICFENVSFNYADGKEGIKNVSLNINAANIVAIKGEQGAGKSTILKLLTGAYKNFTGKILLNNIPINNYQLQSLRQNTGIFLSKQDVFEGSLLENITMGNPSVTVDKIQPIANIIGINNFISNLPLGYDTKIEYQGKKLSEGIKSNLLLLRALVNSNSLLLLENPFEFLNLEQQKSLLNYLKTTNTTVLYTTQSNCTSLQFCNTIVSLKDATILSIKNN